MKAQRARSEAGWKLHEIRDLLGHTSLEQACTYLNVKAEGLEEAMARFGTGAKVGQGEAPSRNLLQFLAMEAPKPGTVKGHRKVNDDGKHLIQ